jgi:hypothetical protein
MLAERVSASMAHWGIWHPHVRKEWRLLANSSSERSVMMMLLTSVVMTIRTGRGAAHSAAWFARVAATGLAQRHAPPEVACELAHFLWQWHWLIEIGQELPKHSSSCHLSCSPHHFLLHFITLPCPIDCPGHITYNGAFTYSPVRA